MATGLANLTEEFESFARAAKVLEEWKISTAKNMDDMFLIIMGIIIYLMQGGFALIEAGCVRSKNTTNILIKNLLDSFISGVFYWIFGYAFAFGAGNAFIGHEHFAHIGLSDSSYSSWFFQYVFAATAATIVSGAVAERCEFAAYLVYSSVITGFIYPVLTHWAWTSEGWLSRGFTYDSGDNSTTGTVTISYQDFAGSGVVHVCGGVAAFVGAAVMGARIGRFDKETGKPEDIKGHSVPLAALGGFILIFGFLAFNGSSQGAISNPGDGVAVAMAIKNTVMSGTSGAFTTMFLNKLPCFGDRKWSFATTLNGALAGMVSICAGCNQMETYSAFLVGIGGGIAYMVTTWLVLFKLKVDDPLDACAVHYGGGTWGVIAVGLLSRDVGIFYRWDAESALTMVWQLTGLLAIIAWTGALCFIMFFTLKKLHSLRVTFEAEMKGLDIPKHGEPAYPAEAYGHGWGEKGDTLFTMVRKATQGYSSTIKLAPSELSLGNVSVPSSNTDKTQL
ncbi:putative ammonium transporter 1 [Ostrea edulis]|uniref:putative ammonium transporter 1 n=1 Tax=Ostrea edulis TaxID=37623 RepID=UPI002094A993|nr:putative ammonium transporter 1 [Ostrea edulis]